MRCVYGMGGRRRCQSLDARVVSTPLRLGLGLLDSVSVSALRFGLWRPVATSWRWSCSTDRCATSTTWVAARARCESTCATASATTAGTRSPSSDPPCRRSLTRPVLPIEIKETGVSSGRRTYSPRCRQRAAILLLQLWQGCQVCLKISAQLPPKASPI